jgi:hypothetical protein
LVLDAGFLTALETEIKALGWKKLAGFFYRHMNEQTLSHFTVFDKDGGLVRAQMHTSNKKLNRVSWRIYGLPETFGSEKDHLSNSTKCNITAAFFAWEERKDASNVQAIARQITNVCMNSSVKFDNIKKIKNEIDRKIKEEPNIDRDIELICTYIELAEFHSAKKIIQEKKDSNFPGYPLSFYARAENYIGALA